MNRSLFGLLLVVVGVLGSTQIGIPFPFVVCAIFAAIGLVTRAYWTCLGCAAVLIGLSVHGQNMS